jgi:predicted translin family RNA/ssDNA-binding protein
MAEVNVKTLQTRIALKYDSYSAWTTAPGKDLVLLAGELGICYIGDANQGSNVVPTVLFKVGDGTKTFENLPWASAKAADVYSWAKASEVKRDGKKLVFVGGKIDGSNLEVEFDYVTLAEVQAITNGLASRIEALEGKFTGTGSVQGQLDALDGRLDAIEGENGAIAQAEAAAKKYTDDREVEIKKYADQAEADAVATAKGYTDTEVKKVADALDLDEAALAAHIADKENPHGVTAAQVGLGKVENKTVAEIKTEFTGEIAADNAGFVTGGGVYTAIEAAKTAANTYADGLNTAMDTRVDALEAAKTAQDTKNGELEQAIEDEASARATAITNATNDITSAYEAADLAINNKIGTVTEGKTVVGMISDAQTAAEGKVTELANGQVETNRAAIAAMDTAYKKAVSDEAKARDDADKALDERLVEVEAFFKTAEGETIDKALDTLVEIQDYLNGEGDATGGLISRIAQAETDIDNLEKEFNTETGRVTVAEKAIDAVEADLAGYKTTVTKALAGKQDVIPENTYDAYGSAANVKTYVDGDFKTAVEGYADGKASAAQAAAEKTASDALAAAVQTLNAKDQAQDTEIAKKLDKTTFESHTTSDHAKTATEITAEIAAAVSGEKTLREAADAAIEKKIGGNYTETSTVADAIAGVKTTADNAAAALAELTGDNGRVKAAENAIDAIELIVNDASKGNDKLRTDVNALQTLTSDAAKGNEALYTEVTRVAGLVDNATTGLAATKAIADKNKTDISGLDSRVTAIEGDYLKQADLFIINCGTSTTVTHTAPTNN